MINTLKILWSFFSWISICLATMSVSAAMTMQMEQDRISVNETVHLGVEIAGKHSQSLTLQVSETSVAENNLSGSAIFIETEVGPDNPYVQGMVHYTVRVFFAAMLTMARVSEPELDNALVRQMGEDREYSVIREGRRYQVVERRYAVFPQQSGNLVIPAPVLDGSVAEYSIANQRRNFHAFGRGAPNARFASTRPVRIRGEAEILSVQSRPAEMRSDAWLPAEQVELDEEWQSQDSKIHVGDPLKRSVVIRARGVVGEQLPDMHPGSVDGFKVYLNTIGTDTRDLKDSIEGMKRLSMTFVPNHPGQFTLPAVYLQWWDTRDNQARIAQLPERTIKVLPALYTEELSSPSAAGLPVNNFSAVSDIWPWTASFVFALLWLITAGMWWRSNRHKAEAAKKIAAASTAWQPPQIARTQFVAACKANDAGVARRRLLEWATAYWPDDPPAGLASLACRFTDPNIQDALNTLDRSLYCGEHDTWDGSQLAELIQKLPEDESRTIDKNVLPGLYERK